MDKSTPNQGEQNMRTLTLDQVKLAAPSVFAEHPRHNVSEVYKFIPTSSIVEKLYKDGFKVESAWENLIRDQSKKGFQKHIIKMVRDDLVIGDDMAQVIITNSHDRTSSFKVLAGVFRFACHNGLVVGGFASGGTFRHVESTGNVIDAVYRVVEEVPQVVGQINMMKSAKISDSKAIGFAKKAAELRWGKDQKIVDPRDLLTIERMEDSENNLWTVMNVVQEHLVRGGLRTLKPMKNGTSQRARSVEKTIDKNLELNQQIWNLAMKLAA